MESAMEQGVVPPVVELTALRERIMGKGTQARAPSKVGQLLEQLRSESFLAKVVQVVPEGVPFDPRRFVLGVARVVEGDPRLQATEPQSVLRCVLECAGLGLTIGGPAQQAYLAARSRRDGRSGFRLEAQLVLGYRGLIAMAMRSGTVKSIQSRIVTEREILDENFQLYYEGDKDVMLHRPILMGEQGEPVLVYCLVRFTDGTFHVEPIRKEELEELKAKSLDQWNVLDGDSPWVTQEQEMWRNASVRRALKYLNVWVDGLDKAIKLGDEREHVARENPEVVEADDCSGARSPEAKSAARADADAPGVQAAGESSEAGGASQAQDGGRGEGAKAGSSDAAREGNLQVDEAREPEVALADDKEGVQRASIQEVQAAAGQSVSDPADPSLKPKTRRRRRKGLEELLLTAVPSSAQQAAVAQVSAKGDSQVGVPNLGAMDGKTEGGAAAEGLSSEVGQVTVEDLVDQCEVKADPSTGATADSPVVEGDGGAPAQMLPAGIG